MRMIVNNSKQTRIKDLKLVLTVNSIKITSKTYVLKKKRNELQIYFAKKTMTIKFKNSNHTYNMNFTRKFWKKRRSRSIVKMIYYNYLDLFTPTFNFIKSNYKNCACSFKESISSLKTSSKIWTSIHFKRTKSFLKTVTQEICSFYNASNQETWMEKRNRLLGSSAW